MTCFLIAWMMAACSGAGGPAGDGGSSGTAGCTPGLDNCTCIAGGLCVAGLVCIDGMCQSQQEEGDTEKEPVEGSTGGAGGGESGGAGGSCVGFCGTRDGECGCDPLCSLDNACCSDYEEACAVECAFAEDCAGDEICSGSTFTCEKAHGHNYGVVVTEWRDHADVCWDFGACFSPDPFYSIRICGEIQFASATLPNTTTASWTTEGDVVITDDCVFLISMSDEDLSNDDWILTWCVRNAADQCWVVPTPFLREGRWEGFVDGAGSGEYWLTIEFRP